MSFLRKPYVPFDVPIPPPPEQNREAVCVTFDRKWIPYLVGTVKALATERTWESDSKRAALEAQDLFVAFMQAFPCSDLPGGGIEMEDCMGCCIRIQDGHLQVFTCGEWQDVPGGDLNALIGQESGQPPIQGEIPTDATSTACLDIPAQGFTPYPAAVGPGYTIEVTDYSGQWSDGADTTFGIFDWYCGNGALTLGIGCAGVQHLESTDPLPTAPHMGLIAKIEPDIILYLMNGPVIIPSTATGNVLQLQCNDSDISDNTGEISACIKVTNGAAHSASLLLDTGSSASADTPWTAVVGKTYKVTISGRGVVGSGPTSFDAFYYDVSGSPVRATTSGSFCGFTNILQLTVDGHEFSPIPAFNSGDLYVCYLLGTGAPFSFVYCDSDYSDNHGTLQIDVEEVAAP